MATKDSTRRVTVLVEAPLMESQDAERQPAAAAYAFSPGGKFLAVAELDKGGKATLDLKAVESATGIRVLVGPVLKDTAPRLEELIRRGAQERHVRIEVGNQRVTVDLSIVPEVWRCWLLGVCTVKGTVLKRVVRDGIASDQPVCHATVEVYEVDPLHIIVPKLPKDLLDRLRHIVLRPIPVPPPMPDPPPFRLPIPDPIPFAATHELTDQEATDKEFAHAVSLIADSLDLRVAAASGSDLHFQRALSANPRLIQPILCRLFPLFVTKTLVGTATTDDCGHFHTVIFKSCTNHDQPDLYFKVKQRIFGFLTVTIYAPTPVACHTWWNYDCGTEVSLHTTHPLAITCSPCPPIVAGDNWVLFMAIGNHALSRIYGTSQGQAASTTATNLGLTAPDGRPWGGLLRPRLQFDNSLRDTLGVQYYRLSWKRESEPDTAYKPFLHAVNRHYAHMVGTDLVLDAYLLGPKTVGSEGGLFEIPPAVPPVGQWSIPDAVEDTTSGKLDTVAADGTPIVDGKIQLKVELFDAAGAAVNIATKGIRYFVPTSEDLTATIQTADAATLGLVSGNSMVITLRVNNEPCSASIAAPSIGGAFADVCCGVLKYAPEDTVTMPWQANHPHGFATYGFGVVRGVNGVVNQSGVVGSGTFSIARSVNQLMNDNLPAGCSPGGCSVAGFSENLYVYATATDGWGRQSQNDRSAVRAFVLASQ